MNQRLLILILSLTNLSLFAQQKEGKITYSRTVQMKAFTNINGHESVLPQTKIDNYELNFANNKSLWKHEDQDNTETNDGGGGGMQIKMIVAGSNDVLFTDLNTKKTTEKKELFEENYIVDDSIHNLQWKITDETKTILNHSCLKAEATKVFKRTSMTIDNGVMQRKIIEDTSKVVAWFTGDIPVAVGPAEYQGQLPGAVLEFTVGNGTQSFVATSINAKPDVKEIEAPSGKKHISAEDFKKEQAQKMEQMGKMRMKMKAPRN